MKATWIAAILAGTAGAAIAQTPQAAPSPAPAPHAMQHPQTRDGVVAMVRDHFARMDANRDGYLTTEEMSALRAERRAKRMAQRGAAPGARGGAGFEKLDTNRDNQISREEFDQHRAMRAQKGGKMGMRGHEGMMRRADTDGDGRVSLAEAQARAIKHFDMVDINRDGQVTPQERQQRRQQRMQQRGQRAPKVG